MRKPRKLRSRKAGLPPGSLVHIGEIKTPESGITLLDFGPDGLVETRLAQIHDLAGYHQQHVHLWANIYGLREGDDLAGIGSAFELHPLLLEDILNTNQRQKAESYGDYLYLVLHRYEVAEAPACLVQDQISLVIGRGRLLCFQERPSKTFEPIRERQRKAEDGLRVAGMDMLAYSLIDSVVDSYFGVIEQLDERAERLEAEILGGPGPGVLEQIHQFRRCVSHLRRNLYPLRELLGGLHREHARFFGSDIQLYLRDVYDHTVHIVESLDDLRELATSLLDVHLTTSSQRLNLELRTLTVVATIFMPATLIAGIFGMNFHTMPWLREPRGFLYATGLMLAIAAVMVLLFWRRR